MSVIRAHLGLYGPGRDCEGLWSCVMVPTLWHPKHNMPYGSLLPVTWAAPTETLWNPFSQRILTAASHLFTLPARCRFGGRCIWLLSCHACGTLPGRLLPGFFCNSCHYPSYWICSPLFNLFVLYLQQHKELKPHFLCPRSLLSYWIIILPQKELKKFH